MVFFDLLKTFIFLVSSVLLYPVLILLSASAVYIIWSAGRFLGEWMERARCGGFDPAKDSPQEFRFPLPVRRYREMLKHLDLHDDAAVAYLMRQAVAERQGALEKYKILIRLAPALGLLGTLIPMGTALASVGTGRSIWSARNLFVAFTTTRSRACCGKHCLSDSFREAPLDRFRYSPDRIHHGGHDAMKFMRNTEHAGDSFDDDPMSSVGNLFDIALVFIVALLFALMATFGKEFFEGKTAAKVDSSGKIEIITRQGREVKSLKQSDEKSEGRGVRLGTAYRLEDGTTIYVPEE